MVLLPLTQVILDGTLALHPTKFQSTGMNLLDRRLDAYFPLRKQNPATEVAAGVAMLTQTKKKHPGKEKTGLIAGPVCLASLSFFFPP